MSSSTLPRERGRRRLRSSVVAAVALSTLALSLSVTGLVVRPVDARAAEGEPLVLAGPGKVTIEVTPADLSTVRQGDTVTFHFSGLRKNDKVSLGTCPLISDEIDFDYTYITGFCNMKTPTGLGGNADLTDLNNNPGLSTSATNGYARPDGTLDVNYLVGSGTSLLQASYWKKGDFDSTIIDQPVCDADNPCAIGLSIDFPTRPYSWRDWTSLTISPALRSQDTSGCAGLDPAVTLNASGPERLQNTMSLLNRAFCAAAASATPALYVPGGSGENDAASVQAVGTTVDLAVAGSPLLTKYPAGSDKALIPIALNAVTVAQFGGSTQASNTPAQVAYNNLLVPPLTLTSSDVAKIVLHDFPTSTGESAGRSLAQSKKWSPLAADLLSRKSNGAALARFDPSLLGLPLFQAPTVTYSLGADSTAIALSGYLVDTAASAWRFPENPENEQNDRSGDAVGLIEGFGTLVDPATGPEGNHLTSQTSSTGGLYSASYGKDFNVGDQQYPCPPKTAVGDNSFKANLSKGCLRFGVMDTETATELQFTATRLPAGDGFVAPAAESLAAAATTAGQVNGNGYFPVTGAGEYPLTFVEYAVVPKAPLLDDSCRVRGQQAELAAYLKYVVGDGQAVLPAGLAPLTDSLKAEAAAGIAQIGTGPVPARCVPKPAVTPTPVATTPPVVDSGDDGGTDSGSGGGSASGGGTGGTATTPVPVAAPAPPAAAKPLPSTVPVALKEPGFGGITQESSSTVVIGLLMLAGLMSAAALGISNGFGPRQLLSRLMWWRA